MLPELIPAVPPSPVVWVGFSGGLDSTVLLHRLRNDPELTDCNVRAIHVHHGLQVEADAWARHCQTLCDVWNVRLHIARIRIADRTRNIEQQAREARYAAFADTLAQGDTLALAHHADDVAETLLLRLMRGAGTDALANMQATGTRDGYRLWRPLLASPRSELMAYAVRQRLDWIEDSSNADSSFDRNFIRHEILPRLDARFPGVHSRLRRSAGLLSADAALLEPLINARFEDCRTAHGLCLKTLMVQPEPMQAHVLRHWLMQAGRTPPGADAMPELLRQLAHHADDAATGFDGVDYRLRPWNGTLYLLGKSLPHTDQPFAQLWDGREPLQLPRGGSLAWSGPVPFSVSVRYRSGGERIRLPGRSIHHSVKKLLSTRLPPWQRDTLPFVYNDQNELLAVGDLLISDALSRASGSALDWQPPSEQMT